MYIELESKKKFSDISMILTSLDYLFSEIVSTFLILVIVFRSSNPKTVIDVPTDGLGKGLLSDSDDGDVIFATHSLNMDKI
ncbi:hypothetical protein M0812_08540 [Anaeramoeba flamelloides]|nr:hypothetical protein M0812_08540 [Anaeramoeba flamelloides]